MLFTYLTNRIIKYGLVFPLMLLLVVSLAFSGEYSKGQSITDVPKFTTQPDIGTEEEPTIKDDAEEEETIEEDETEEDSDAVTSVPPKRPIGTDSELKNLTVAPIEEPGKLIFASCQKNFPNVVTPEYVNDYEPISCNVPGASPGDNIVVSSTAFDSGPCNFIASSQVSKPNVVSILLYYASSYDYPFDHGHGPPCRYNFVGGTVIFSIIVFRPEVPDIIGSLKELQD